MSHGYALQGMCANQIMYLNGFFFFNSGGLITFHYNLLQNLLWKECYKNRKKVYFQKIIHIVKPGERNSCV